MENEMLPAVVNPPSTINEPYTEDDFPMMLKVEYEDKSQLLEVYMAEEFQQSEHPSVKTLTIEGIPKEMLDEDIVLSIKKVLSRNMQELVEIN